MAFIMRITTECSMLYALHKYYNLKTLDIHIKWAMDNVKVQIFLIVFSLHMIILLHECECWTPKEDLERRLEAAEMWYIRRIMRISSTEKKSNEEVMEMAGYKSKKKMKKKTTTIFLWHINRAAGLEKQIRSGKICGTKSRGRQRTKCTGSLNNFVTRKESSNNDIIRRTEDREDQ